MDFIYLIFYACLRVLFLGMETNPGQRRPVPAVCRILCSNVRGLAGNLSDLTVALSQYGILLCFETLVSDMWHVSEILVPAFGRHVLLCLGKMVTEHFANSNLSVVVAKCWFSGFVAVQEMTYISLILTVDS